jgi:myo-inositol 2-dehydrogenase/D-chiro-inositol 1-dehydrogenase
MHVEPVLKALQKNINVFSEKPMATSLSEAKKIVDAVKKSKAIYNLGFNRRFAPVYKKVKNLIEKKKFIPHSAHIKMNRGELQNPVWVSDKNITGGFLYETTIHIFDMIIWLLGDVERIVCFGNSNFYGEIDDFHIILKFKNEILVTLTSCGHSSWIYPFERVELFGNHSSIITEEMNKVSYTLGLNQPVITEEYFTLTLPERWGYLEEDKLFIEAVKKNKKPPVSVEDAYKSVELVELCYKNMIFR